MDEDWQLDKCRAETRHSLIVHKAFHMTKNEEKLFGGMRKGDAEEY